MRLFLSTFLFLLKVSLEEASSPGFPAKTSNQPSTQVLTPTTTYNYSNTYPPTNIQGRLVDEKNNQNVLTNEHFIYALLRHLMGSFSAAMPSSNSGKRTRELVSGGIYSSSHRGKQTQCKMETNRSDCGFPGITREQCLRLDCCWNSSRLGAIWCFQPNGRRRNPQRNIVNQVLMMKILGSLPVTRTQLRNPLNSFQLTSTNEISQAGDRRMAPYSAEEWQFLSKVENEISGLNRTLLPTTSLQAPPSRPTSNTTTREQALLELFFELLLRSSTSGRPTPATRQVSTLLPHTTRNPSFSSHGNALVLAAITPSNQLHQTRRYNNIAAMLRLITELRFRGIGERQCQRDSNYSCCASNPTSPCCGFREGYNAVGRATPITRIVGGQAAGQLRSSVAHLSELPSRRFFCGGSLVGRVWVLTAAHCVLKHCQSSRTAPRILVSLGKYRKHSFLHDQGQQNIIASSVICHSDQCKRAGRPRINDVALIRLSRSAVYSTFVTLAFLPRPLEFPGNPRNKCIVLGFGNTEGSGFEQVMKEAAVPLVSNSQCNLPQWRNCTVSACMMCAGDVNVDACPGDSGGPLFCQRNNGLYVLHGVFIWGRCGASAQKPGVYTRTSFFIDWMTRIMKSFQIYVGK